MKGKAGRDEINKMYPLILELHNKIADSLNHLATEKENLEDAIDALNRIKKMGQELEKLMVDSKFDGVSKKLDKFNAIEARLDKALSDYSQGNKFVFNVASEFAHSWNMLEEELGAVIEKINSKTSSTPPYIR